MEPVGIGLRVRSSLLAISLHLPGTWESLARDLEQHFWIKKRKIAGDGGVQWADGSLLTADLLPCPCDLGLRLQK